MTDASGISQDAMRVLTGLYASGHTPTWKLTDPRVSEAVTELEQAGLAVSVHDGRNVRCTTAGHDVLAEISPVAPPPRRKPSGWIVDGIRRYPCIEISMDCTGWVHREGGMCGYCQEQAAEDGW